MPRTRKRANKVGNLSAQEIEHLKTLQRGIDLQREEKLKEAEFCYQLVLRDSADHPDANNLMGTLAIEADELAIAVDFFKKALKKRPKDPNFRNNLGNAFVLAKEPSEAVSHLRRAIKAKPDFVEALVNLANAYRQLGRATLAREQFEKAVRLHPDHPSALIGFGEVLTELGEMDEAISVFRDAIKRNVSPAQAFHYLSTVHTFSTNDPEPDLIEDRIADPTLDEMERVSLHHSAGKMQSDLKRHDDAFAHFSKAKEIVGANFHIAKHRKTYDQVSSLFTPAFFDERKDFGVASERPVFIVGMPRSGTTLTEQIAASHPKVFGAGELSDVRQLITSISGSTIEGQAFVREMGDMTPARSRELAERYLAVLKKHSRSAERVTDKLPHNFELLGFIALLFPNAKVVHCRRNPIDTCVSCFTHQFSDFHGYNSNLNKLGLYYREYVRLMQHWETALPMTIFENRYETMTSDQEAQTRKLIDHIGLEWDDRCLTFYETKRLVQTPSRWQVRQPIYRSSVKSWKKYEQHLGPLIDALGDLVANDEPS